MANTYTTSAGDRFTQSQIRTRLTQTYRGMMLKYICEGCKARPAVDHDHTISQSRCKTLHRTELIWTEGNIEYSCRKCHEEWEGYKSGDFQYHYNAKKRLTFMTIFYEEGTRKRMNYIESGPLKEYLETLLKDQ